MPEAIPRPWTTRALFWMAALAGLGLLLVTAHPWFVDQPRLPVFGLALRPWALGLAGLGAAYAGAGLLALLRGTPPVTGGGFRLCRHPMILGELLLYAAWCALLGSAALALSIPPLALALDRLVAAREEAQLLDTFPEQYGAYMAKVGRWLPFTWPRAKS